MDIQPVELPSLRVLAYRRVGPYGPAVGEAFCKLVGFAQRNSLFCGSSIVVGAYHDCPKATAPEQCRMDACITLEPNMNPALEDGFRIETLQGGLFVNGLSSVYNNNFAEPYERIAAWMQERNYPYDPSRPCYEFYYGPCADTHPLKKWIVDFFEPVKPRV